MNERYMFSILSMSRMSFREGEKESGCSRGGEKERGSDREIDSLIITVQVGL
jgi:hypothetical protein